MPPTTVRRIGSFIPRKFCPSVRHTRWRECMVKMDKRVSCIKLLSFYSSLLTLSTASRSDRQRQLTRLQCDLFAIFNSVLITLKMTDDAVQITLYKLFLTFHLLNSVTLLTTLSLATENLSKICIYNALSYISGGFYA